MYEFKEIRFGVIFKLRHSDYAPVLKAFLFSLSEFKYLLCSQVSPVNLSMHSHLKPFPSTKHVPKFLQGFGLQSSNKG